MINLVNLFEYGKNRLRVYKNRLMVPWEFKKKQGSVFKNRSSTNCLNFLIIYDNLLKNSSSIQPRFSHLCFLLSDKSFGIMRGWSPVCRVLSNRKNLDPASGITKIQPTIAPSVHNFSKAIEWCNTRLVYMKDKSVLQQYREFSKNTNPKKKNFFRSPRIIENSNVFSQRRLVCKPNP